MESRLTLFRGMLVRGFSPRIGVRDRPSIARVSVLSVKYIPVAGTGDCRMPGLFPTQAGDKPPRYIFLPPSGLRFFE